MVTVACEADERLSEGQRDQNNYSRRVGHTRERDSGDI